MRTTPEVVRVAELVGEMAGTARLLASSLARDVGGIGHPVARAAADLAVAMRRLHRALVDEATRRLREAA